MRYMTIIEAITHELVNPMSPDELMKRLWNKYVKNPNGERIVMRLYKNPAGGYWSPDVEEALEILRSAGLVVVENGKLRISGGVTQ